MQYSLSSSYVDVKTVTWSKDSHGLFDYESKSINFTKHKLDCMAQFYKDETGIVIKKGPEVTNIKDMDKAYLFSMTANKGKENKYHLHVDENSIKESSQNKSAFLIVRSLKDEDGNQKGYDLELGDVIRLGRIEYRLIEYQNDNQEVFSLFQNEIPPQSVPFVLNTKDCDGNKQEKSQCRICLMDEEDVNEPLVNPCNCKGTSEYVHIKCLQDWLSSKAKVKTNSFTTCSYWKKLLCEVCKISLPELVIIGGEKKELIPISRPTSPYVLLERIFYDKSKSNSENSRTLILLSVSNKTHQIKLGRGHECDLRENDISVSRLHAFIKYHDGKFTIFDNSSKFGTLILLRRDFKIEKKKVAIQIGRTVVTFSVKQTAFPALSKLTKLTLLEPLKHTNKTADTEVFDDNAKSPLNSSFEKKENDANLSFID